MTESYPKGGGSVARTTKVLAVSLPPDLVREYEALAKRLRKNKSELFREVWAAFKTVRAEEEFYRAQRRLTREAGAAARRAGRKWPLTEAEVERIVFEDR
ncbi:MAG: ribbon-helix-helix protein, CopG family [candidate division NC10 bacterium]|nr:ribbon-helix-helix protein, CopG family [candidate division NC10 bacterium]